MLSMILKRLAVSVLVLLAVLALGLLVLLTVLPLALLAVLLLAVLLLAVVATLLLALALRTLGGLVVAGGRRRGLLAGRGGGVLPLRLLGLGRPLGRGRGRGGGGAGLLGADGGDEVALAHLGGAGDPHARGELLELGEAHGAQGAGATGLLAVRGSGVVAGRGVGHEGPFPRWGHPGRAGLMSPVKSGMICI